ncbi:hypothetical protein AgCh_014965 [Apium graveolens]
MNFLSASSFLLLFLHLTSQLASSESYLGINYGQVANNLPPPREVAKLLQSTSIQKVRLFGADTTIIQSLANTNIEIAIGASNTDIPALAADPNFAKSWINSNIIPFYPSSKITTVNVGNEIMSTLDRSLMYQLLKAMQNVQNALNEAMLGGKIKVTTVHSMTILKKSDPPSGGRFDPTVEDLLKGLLEFNNATGSGFSINPYPFFAYESDPRPETLAFCLFQPNSGRVDPGTGIKYTNMFDAQVSVLTHFHFLNNKLSKFSTSCLTHRSQGLFWYFYICLPGGCGLVDERLDGLNLKFLSYQPLTLSEVPKTFLNVPRPMSAVDHLAHTHFVGRPIFHPRA